MNWKNVSDDFPINKELIWLNNCGTTSSCLPVEKAVMQYMQGFTKSGINQKAFPMGKIRDESRSILARLLNCEVSEIALIHNTNEGMMFLSGGLDLSAGDEILLLENEYPSNVYPWEHWTEKGVKISFIQLAATTEQQILNIQSAITPQTKVISLSSVHWCTGMPMPLEETGKICQEQDIWYFVDGAQGVGHIELDMKKIKADAICFSAWKWLLGPLGLGVMAITQKACDELKFPFKGCESVIHDQNYLPYQTGIKSGAARYMTSTAPYIEWIYFHTILQYLDNIGFASVRARIYELAGILENGLERLGFSVLSKNFPGQKTGIICSKHPLIKTPDMIQALAAENIVARERGGHIRMAPHIYQNEEQMARVLEVIEKNLRS